ncbi:hypothetical protein CRM83_04830 [Escherichia coli]|uniref:YdjO n=1 Tax=Escherichia coli O104:H4 (strain 2011C-3493) TaxID=1133852 RepID=A0A0E0XYA9_ECO1C|nr:ydjO [Escherichia coli O104:H4 str. 2011C-3493]AKE84113.1 hypothetical protein AAF13_08295 [Escherichia coli O104:H4 str. C227-11]ATG10403.1 hypothetical protein CO706_05615 [Escherichia coli]EHF24019.1 hypothetical protein EUBG_02312 [Escherichia coli O104:H4 str. C236-11]EHF41673.1 hypothetical protein EUFG_02312 [Escherichia coli O104:H4 str. 11-3677]EHF51491.1 hypothetical protein EUHG_02313 [Escherichia coli O104:H4 str. 11-4404]EHF54725.1 hypothetical protein EUIG_02315 [Escherichia 
MMSLWDALRMNMMISYQELVRTFLRKRLGYEVLSFSLQAHSLSQECIDKLDIFFADDLFKYESVCIAAMEHLKSKATAPIQNGPLPA